MFFLKNKKREEKSILAYQELLRRKDREIEELRKTNELLIKTSLKQAKSANEWKEYAQRLERENNQLKEIIEKKKKNRRFENG